MNNKEFYKETFDEVHIPNELFGEVVQMNKQKKKKNKHYRIAAAAALVLLCAATGASAYAAMKHWNLAGFFSETGNTIPKEAEKLLENEPEQDTAKQLKKSETEEDISTYITSKITESLCDSSTIHCNLAITPKEPEKYLVLPSSYTDSLIMSGLGITGADAKLTAWEYAKKQKKKILFVDAFIDQEISPKSFSSNEKLDSDGTLHYRLSMDNKTKKAEIHCSCTIILYGMNAAYQNNLHDDREICGVEQTDDLKEQLDFTVRDNSHSQTGTYIPHEDSQLKDSGLILDNVRIKTTETGAYVTFNYHTLADANLESKIEEDDLVFDLVDQNGQTLKSGLSDGGSSADLGNGKYQCSRNYEQNTLPKKIRVKIFDCGTKEVYGYMDIPQKK